MNECTVEQWLAELEAATRSKGSGMTALEIADRLGWSVFCVRKNLLHPAKKAGRLIVDKDARENLDGRIVSQSVYRFKPKDEE